MVYLYFNSAHAIRVHDEIINLSGGKLGLLNIGLLKSVLEHVKNDSYYANLEEKVTHLCFSINKNHAFDDGNKRSSIALSAFFLELNGFDFRVSKYIKEMENIAVDIADNRINKGLLLEVITSIINENDYSEELKLKILSAKSK